MSSPGADMSASTYQLLKSVVAFTDTSDPVEARAIFASASTLRCGSAVNREGYGKLHRFRR